MENTKLALTIGMVVLISALGAGYYIVDLDHTYYCESKELAAGCFKMSTPDAEIHTRCYYDTNNTKKYVYCKEGWNSISDYPDLVANLTAEPANLDKEADVEKTIVNIDKDVSNYEYWIVGVEKYPDLDGPSDKIFKCEYKEKI